MSIFDPQPGDGVSILNWLGQPLDQLFLYADAYQRAGRSLLVSLELDNGALTDFDACPIVFLYRHSLELNLKSILLAGCSVLRCTPEQILRDGHDMKKLLAKVKQLYEAVGIVPDAELEEAVNDITLVDANSFAFRYTITKDLDPALRPNFTFSVIAFARRLDPILDRMKGDLHYVVELVGMPRD